MTNLAGGNGTAPGTARLHLADGVPLLRPEEQVFEAMLDGWRRGELQAFLDHADDEVSRVRGRGRKGWLPAFRDAMLFKTAYAFGLRRNETRMPDLADFGRNPEGTEFGEYGVCYVRHGQAKKGSPPKRRSVLTVWDWSAEILDQWVSEVRPAMRNADGPALWPSERGRRVGLQRLDSRFATYRDDLGLDPVLDFHSL
ncbi:hypothetical protein [Streptomyces sp. NPDC094472]|uniref:hypothetical protein n=1 Tax=Streptomyces sp. NPDC094472 TaxID=3155080 RepID=UPI00332F38F4